MSWCDSISAIISIKQCFDAFGVRWNNEMQQIKQSIISTMITLDDDNKITNKKLWSTLLPNKNWQSTDTFLSKCKEKRILFDVFDEPNFIGGEEKNKKRES